MLEKLIPFKVISFSISFFFWKNEVLNEGKNYTTLYALFHLGWLVFSPFASFFLSLMSHSRINKEQPGLLWSSLDLRKA